MGLRGRAKAKHTKKARELKYNSPGLDAESLQRELAGVGSHDSEHSEDDYDDYEDDDRRR